MLTRNQYNIFWKIIQQVANLIRWDISYNTIYCSGNLIMAILYLSGKVDKNGYINLCENNKIEAEKAVFIFPGNTGHHGSKHNLYSVKSGSGLAIPAGELGRDGFPVLSLPTTGMENWSKDEKIEGIANKAIADLWRAVGAGYHLVLPVRNHNNDTYFSESLKDTKVEPNFWGGIQMKPNKALADHYTNHLNILTQFIAVIGTQQEEEALEEIRKKHPDLVEAYHTGKKMKENDSWLQSPANAASEREKKTPKVIKEIRGEMEKNGANYIIWKI